MSEPDQDWAEIVWADGSPRSSRFDDTYFSAEDGLAETRAVFLAGCGLPEAWAGRRRFTIGELGFGTGLNILAALDLWRRTRPSPAATLHLFSVEAYPMARAEAERALARWPELADLTDPLLAGWPDGRRGWRRIAWPEIGATLDLAVEEVGAALSGWTGAADAWFLDGFAPARNPEMWRDEVLAAVATRTAPGGRLASFTVAGAVRRGLEAQGLEVERAPGFGRKKQRLEARRLGPAPAEGAPPRVALIGAGIAGASLKRAFDRLGVEARVFDAAGAGAGASGNPAALVTPRLDAGLGGIAELYSQAFAHAVEVYRTEAPEAMIATGALQLETAPRDGGRYDRIAAWNGFAAGALTRLAPAAASTRLGEAGAPGALAYRDALVIEPHALFSAWLAREPERRPIDRLGRRDGAWVLLGEDGEVVAEADVVVIASGHASSRFMDLPLRPVRGQVSLAAMPFTGEAAAWGGYAIPTRTGTLFGATHDRGDTASDVRAEDHARNLAALAEGRPALAVQVREAPLQGRASVRAATPDHLPLAGAAPGMEGAYLLTGLGGRGFTLAPVLAEQVAAQALRLAGPLPRHLQELVNPGRYGPVGG